MVQEPLAKRGQVWLPLKLSVLIRKVPISNIPFSLQLVHVHHAHFCVLVGNQPDDLHILGMGSTTDLNSQPFSFFFFLFSQQGKFGIAF
jgi:hypothetical protein